MQLTINSLKIGTGSNNPDHWLPLIQAACDEFEINTPLRMAAFLAQIGVESEGLSVLIENLNYSASVLPKQWPTRFTTELANRVGRTTDHPADQQAIANYAYCERGGNGQLASNDGWQYRGRGLIQLTFKSNYAQMGKFLGLDLVNNPDLLLNPSIAARAAACFFAKNKCNVYADSGNFLAICGIVNCGKPSATASQINGFDKRYNLYKKGLACLTESKLS